MKQNLFLLSNLEMNLTALLQSLQVESKRIMLLFTVLDNFRRTVLGCLFYQVLIISKFDSFNDCGHIL